MTLIVAPRGPGFRLIKRALSLRAYDVNAPTVQKSGNQDHATQSRR